MSKSSNKSLRYDPLNDYLFFKIFGEKGDEVQLLGFLNAVLGKTGSDKFTSVKILENKNFTPENIGKKSVTFDVRAVLQGSTKVNVEVQLRNKHNMDKRSLFHWSKEFANSLNKGQDYSELPKVLAINIVDFDYLQTTGFHSCFHLRDDDEKDVILTEVLEIHFINMVRYRKLKRKDIYNDPLCRWLAWLNRNSPPEVLSEVIKMDTSILTADELLAYIAGDEDVIHAYDMRFKAMCDRTSELNYARSKGRKDERQTIARNLLSEGSTPEFIQKITGLNLENIQKLSATRN